ncbi:MAG TPA: protein phosphatase 2C domain-containing protein [Pilimelia sp.]|nr:protein phosphatase 2C domain-containing protein [Pilimelia sp.]
MTLILRSATVSDLGLVRSNNEDAGYAGRRLLAVADGIGGGPAGEWASELVIRTVVTAEDAPAEAEPAAALLAALTTANELIRAAVEGDPALNGSGTTLTALLLSGERLGLLHVGDSRAYLLREGSLRRLTTDDTFVQLLMERGALTAEEARRHPQRSVVIRAVQGRELEATAAELSARLGDRYLVCSDGLSDVVSDELLARTLADHDDPRQCAEQLVRLAVDAGGPDNVTVVIGDVVDSGGDASGDDGADPGDVVAGGGGMSGAGGDAA